MKKSICMAIAVLLAGTVQAESITHGSTTVSMDFVEVGHAGNAVDSSGYGAVDHNYRIGMKEVSIEQFNAVRAADSRVGDGDENYWNDGTRTVGGGAPAARASLIEAMRFANWLTSGDAYAGTYQFNESGSLTNVNRDAALELYGTVYLIPSEDEWYKAAYFKADGSGYSLYANGSDSVPTWGGGGWNYRRDDYAYVNADPNYTWESGVGAIEQNGTYDMMGNVEEWTDNSALRGGSFDSKKEYIGTAGRRTASSTTESFLYGFRIAAVSQDSGISLIFPPEVTNLSALQHPGTKMMEISYDVSSAETNEVKVSLIVSNATAKVSAANVSGDVGAGVATGAGKVIVWDMAADWNGSAADLSYTVVVDDGVKKTVCPVPKSGQTISTRIGDDGEWQSGVEWPDPRFTDNGDGTVHDNLTGLEWILDPQALAENSETMDWESSIGFCNGLDFAGHSDWRMPNRKELVSLLDYGQMYTGLPSGHPFNNVGLHSYWTSTTIGLLPAHAYYVSMPTLWVSNRIKTDSGGCYAWPVRTQYEGEPAPIPQSGQSESYQIGDDGDHEAGIIWPETRFVDTGARTVVDKLTGLEWAKEPHEFPGFSGSTNWNGAVDHCARYRAAGWRLPTVKELESLVFCGKGEWGDETYEWLNSSETPFSGIKEGSYWTGTSKAWSTNSAYFVDFSTGISGTALKSYNKYVWMMRTYTGGGASAVADELVSAFSDSRDYMLEMVAAHGNPVPEAGSHAYAWNSSVTCSVEAVTADGWMFTGWSGAVSTNYPATNVVVLMDSTVKSLIANFSDDVDGDGLLNTNELVLGTDPRNSDSDGDGVPDSDELIALVQSALFGTGSNQFSMEFANIGNPGNTDDLTGFGAVDYDYCIGKLEVSIDQFSKAKAEDSRIGDGDEGYWNDGTRTVGSGAPASYVSVEEAMKFCNWLTTGDAYAGAYQFDAVAALTNVDRSAAAVAYGMVYVLPTEDEWYKAAYFRPDASGYSLYASGLNTLPAWGAGGWNYNHSSSGYAIGPTNYLWTTGSSAQEQNGTYDMMGNISEITESPNDGTLDYITEARGARGASAFDPEYCLKASFSAYNMPNTTMEFDRGGFRVAVIDETSIPPVQISLFSASEIGVATVPGVTYQLQYEMDGGGWTNFAVFTGDGSVQYIFDDAGASRSYRIVDDYDGSAGDVFGSGTNQFTMEFVDIGDPGNAPQSEANRDHGYTEGDGFGSVSYSYRIAKLEVTVECFEKARAVNGSIGNGYEDFWLGVETYFGTLGSNAPAARLTQGDARAFCNWLTTGDPSRGAYGGLSGGGGIMTREEMLAAGGTFYVLPTEDEWQKAAAYKDGHYSLYANGLDVQPPFGAPDGWNYFTDGQVWECGSGGLEQNGTKDMMGNVAEWTEDVDITRGGSSCAYVLGCVRSDLLSEVSSGVSDPFIGFRVASIGDLPSEPKPVVYPAFTLEWETVPGMTYQPQSANDLSSSNWVDMGAAIIGDGSTMQLQDSSRDVSTRFYRVLTD